MPGQVRLDERGEAFVVAFPYSEAAVRAMRLVPGSTYLGKPSRAWRVPLDSAHRLAEFVQDWRVGVAVQVQERRHLNDLSGALDDAACADVAPDLPLLPFQRAGVAYALRTRRCFIADEPGLGKTLQALATAEVDGQWPILVVMPAVVKLNWQRQQQRWLPHRRSTILQGRRVHFIDPTAEFILVNYDILHDWQEVLAALPLAGVVLDESHYIRNRNIRTRAAKAVVSSVRHRVADPLILALTGTPIFLGPKDAVTQLEALNRLGDLGGWPHFNRRYVRGERYKELHDRLRSVCYVRREKADVLPELPPKWRHPLPVEPDPAVMREYVKAEIDVAKYLAERAAEIALAMGEDPGSAAVMARLRAESAIHLVQIAVLKRLAARAKLPPLRDWVRDFLASGKKLVVFAHHVEVVDALAEAFDAVTIKGGMSAEARQRSIDRFQSDMDQKTIVLQDQAGGVGIDLFAASDVLFVEMGWTPAGHDQCEDRCHRIGQKDSVTAWYSIAAGTIDEENYALLRDRRAMVEAIVDGREAPPAEITEDNPDPDDVRGQLLGQSVGQDFLEQFATKALTEQEAAA
jgi:SWI/SNF-related matrix-associated actin-dependent regulator of chromatin subfamily A-like protein 1